jgi:hypothetical protein
MKIMSEPNVSRPMRLRVRTFWRDGGPAGVKYRPMVAIVVVNADIPAKAVARRIPIDTDSPCVCPSCASVLYEYIIRI